MSDVMLFGILSMPLEIIADDGLAIRQFHAKAQEAVVRMKADAVRIEQLEDALKTVVDQWSSQFERNEHLAPEWAKKARTALEFTTTH